jgi:non-canonical (house-cleaning) NTP pyrophosphatase
MNGTDTTVVASSTTTILRVAVGSSNPSKVLAVERALRQAIQDKPHTTVVLDIQSYTVASGVPDQPFGDDETLRGAQNRAQAAHNEFRQANGRHPHLAVGMEGGLDWSTGKNGEEVLFCMAWMAVYGRRQAQTVEVLASPAARVYYGDRKAMFGVSKTASFRIPPTIATLIRQGMELGDADDRVFDRTLSKHGSGTVGILTDGLIDRADYYAHAIVLALAPWIRPDVYPNEDDALLNTSSTL